MSPEKAPYNPHGKSDGGPKPGQAAKFWAYMKEKREKELAELTPQQKADRLKGEDRLNKRMNS